MSKALQIAFDGSGNLINRINRWMKSSSIRTEENSVFDDKLEYLSYEPAGKGGDSKILLKSLNSGRKYCMFMSDFHEIMRNKLFINHAIEAKFTFCKKGSSQGIKLFKGKNI